MNHGVRGLFVVALLDELEQLVASVWPAYAVLVFACSYVYLFLVGVVDGCGRESS